MIKNNLYILRLLSTIIFSFYFCCYSQDYHKRDSLIKVAKENIDTIKIKALNSLGTFYMNVDFDSSLLYSKQALEYAVKINFKKGQGHAYSNIGLVLNKKGNYTEALKNYFKCVIIRDDLHDQKGLCIAYSRIADVYLNSKKTNLAIEYERKALNIALETDNQQSIAGSYNNLGNIYLELKNLDTSLAYYKKNEQIKYSAGYTFNKKFNSRNQLTTGFTADINQLKLKS